MITIQQTPTGGDLDAVASQLDDAFAAMKAAVAENDPVTVVVADGDLLGQGDPCDAAVACALLGMVRTLAIEGAKHGWQLNVVSHRDGAGPVRETQEALASVPGLTGQLVRVGTEHLGKVQP
jgi:hypothetical protein